MNTSSPFSCSQCGSKLILVDSVTEKRENNLFPQTTSTYRCSNKECQDRMDKETEKRQKQRVEKEQADQKRNDERLQKRQQEIQDKINL